jgi:hypothetical protein
MVRSLYIICMGKLLDQVLESGLIEWSNEISIVAGVLLGRAHNVSPDAVCAQAYL